jgi:hypothetical protein
MKKAIPRRAKLPEKLGGEPGFEPHGVGVKPRHLRWGRALLDMNRGAAERQDSSLVSAGIVDRAGVPLPLGIEPIDQPKVTRPSILHVGGVGTNALINSGLLNERGYVSHVAANDMYHCICTPEWQELASKGLKRDELGDDFYPNFFRIAASHDVRPRWFVQGPQTLTICYLYYLKLGLQAQADVLWRTLQYQRFKTVLKRTTVPGSVRLTTAELEAALKELSVAPVFHDGLRDACEAEGLTQRFAQLAARLNGDMDPALIAGPFAPAYINAIIPHDDTVARDVAIARATNMAVLTGFEQPSWMASGAKHKFSPLYPSSTRAKIAQRKASVAAEDAAVFSSVMPAWSTLFDLYDQRMCYGGSAVIGLLSDADRYMAYEHGTIRSIPFDGTQLGRLTKAAFEQADAVFITNTDYVSATQRLEFAPEQRVYVPHAFDERPLLEFAKQYRPLQRLPGPIRLFGPARQDWLLNDPMRSKANHLVVEAASLLVAKGITDFEITFVAWGDDVAATKALIAERGVEKHFDWIEPLARSELWLRYVNTDAILDQFLLSGLSGVTYEALTLGCRAITKDDGVCNKEFFGVPPPFMAAGTAAEIAARIEQLCNDPNDEAAIGAAGVAWIRDYHSGARFVALQEAQFVRLAPPAFAVAEEPASEPVQSLGAARSKLRSVVRRWFSRPSAIPSTPS